MNFFLITSDVLRRRLTGVGGKIVGARDFN
jgi:hypothetical protein